MEMMFRFGDDSGMTAETIRLLAGFLFIGVLVPLLILPYWVIFRKAGFPKWISLFMLIPIVNFVVLYVVAFAKWKPEVSAR